MLGISLLLHLLENQGGARLQERGERHLVGEEGAEVAVLFVEAAENREDEGVIRDLLTNVTESIGKRLELGAVIMDTHVTLWRVAKFRVEGKGAAFLVVVEEVGDGVPDLPRRRARGDDDAEKLGGDRAVDPGEDGEVVTRPIGGGGGVRRRSVGAAGDMAGETIAAEGDEEELVPLDVVGVLQIKGDGDDGLDGGDVGGGVLGVGLLSTALPISAARRSSSSLRA
jgi:hypothetical protein